MASRNRKFSSMQVLTPPKKIVVKDADSPKIFRGFISGAAIRTSKGYFGTKLDSLWSRHILDSLKNDDNELAEIALESMLADVEITVEGGEFGCPYMISNYGFYAKSQFQEQAKHLQDVERAHIASDPRYFLSDGEWQYVDSRLTSFSKFSHAQVEKATRGDSLAVLAARESAFSVVMTLLRAGVDPLVKNEDNEDLFTIMQQRYATHSEELQDLLTDKVAMSKTVIIPTKLQDLLKLEQDMILKMNKLSELCSELRRNLGERSAQILDDKIAKKKADLRNEEVSVQMLWNIAQEEVAEQIASVSTFRPIHSNRIRQNTVILSKYINEKLQRHVANSDAIQIESILKKQQDSLRFAKDAAFHSHISDVIKVKSMAHKKRTTLQSTARLQYSYSIDESGDKVYSIDKVGEGGLKTADTKQGDQSVSIIKKVEKDGGLTMYK